MAINLRLPVKHIFITQPYGVNYLDFYKKMGLPFHPGIDFRAKSLSNCYAANYGKVTRAGRYSDGGNGIEIQHPEGWSTFYYHLWSVDVKEGDTVHAGQIIGKNDNTGKYTTGDHLHFELRVKGEKIDPAPYFTMAYDGFAIGNKDWDKPNVYHRYYRKDGRNRAIEIKVLTSLIRYLKRMPTVNQINACVYGGWAREDVENESMYDLWAYVTKADYQKGIYPFA